MVSDSTNEHPPKWTTVKNINSILAPMIRANTLPFRELCFQNGVDVCYGEEILDVRIANSVRLSNPHYQDIIEYYFCSENCSKKSVGGNVLSAGGSDVQCTVNSSLNAANPPGPNMNISTLKTDCSNGGDRKSVFRITKEEIKRNRTVFQLGTADPETALKAAKIVINDVAGMDVNMGCPKSFSVNRGMGAALLRSPETAFAIIKNLRDNLPGEKSVTCKIRFLTKEAEKQEKQVGNSVKRRKLETPEDSVEKETVIDVPATRDFILGCMKAGAEKVAVHMRMPHERPRHPAHWNEFGQLLDMLTADQRQRIIANGDFMTQFQIKWFREKYPGILLMIARGAQKNPAIFRYINSDEDDFTDISTKVEGGDGVIKKANVVIGKSKNSATKMDDLLLDIMGSSESSGNRSDNPPILDCMTSYVQLSIDCGASIGEIKWNLLKMIEDVAFIAKKPAREIRKPIQETKNVADLIAVFEDASFSDDRQKINYDAANHPTDAHTDEYMRNTLYQHYQTLRNASGD